MPELNTVTDPNLPEPKGAASASANEIYVADGAGSGNWLAIEVSLDALINDISTAQTIYIPIPYTGTIKKVVSVLGGAISGADALITVRNASGVSMGTITVANAGSAAGDVDTLVPTTNNTVAENTHIRIETDGASTHTIPIRFSIILERT